MHPPLREGCGDGLEDPLGLSEPRVLGVGLGLALEEVAGAGVCLDLGEPRELESEGRSALLGVKEGVKFCA